MFAQIQSQLNSIYGDDLNDLRRARALGVMLGAMVLGTVIATIGALAVAGIDSLTITGAIVRGVLWLVGLGGSFWLLQQGRLEPAIWTSLVAIVIPAVAGIVVINPLQGLVVVVLFAFAATFLTGRQMLGLTTFTALLVLGAMLYHASDGPLVADVPIRFNPSQAILFAALVAFAGTGMSFAAAELNRIMGDIVQRTRSLEALAEAGQVTTAHLMVDEMAKEVVAWLMNVLPLKAAALYTVDQRGALVQEAGAGDVPSGRSQAVEQALDTQQTIEATDELALPVALRDDVFGVLDVHVTEQFSSIDRTTLEALTSQLAVAMENIRAVSWELSPLEATSPIFRSLKDVATASSPDDIINTLRRYIVPDADRITLVSFEFDKTGQMINRVMGLWDRNNLDLDAEFPHAIRQDMGRAPIVVGNISTLAAGPLREYARHVMRSESFILLPLSARDRLVGALVIARHEPYEYNEQAIETLNTLAGQIGVVIDNLSLLEQISTQNERLNFLVDLEQQLFKATSLDAFSEILLTSLSPRIEFNYMSITQLESNRVGRILPLEPSFVPTEPRFLLKGSPVAEALEAGQPLTADEMPDWALEDVTNLIIVPIIDEGEPLGTLNIGAETLAPEIRALLTQIGPVVGRGLKNAALLEDLRESVDEYSSLYTATLAMNAAETLDEVYETALNEIATQSDADRVVVYLGGPNPREEIEYVQEAAVWDHGRLLQSTEDRRSSFEEVPILSQFPQSRANLVFPKAQTDARLDQSLRDTFQSRGVKSVMMIPMSTGNLWLGAIIIEDHHSGEHFDSDLVRLCRSIADQTATAVNALLLLNQREEAANRERALREVIGRIRNATDVETVNQIASEEINRVMGGDDQLDPMNLRDTQERRMDPAGRELIESISTQVSLAIQNLNLLTQAEESAFREHMVNEIATQIQQAGSVDDVMHTTVAALQQALMEYDITLRLTTDIRGVTEEEESTP